MKLIKKQYIERETLVDEILFEERSERLKANEMAEKEYIERGAVLLKIDLHGTNKFGMLDEDVREFIKQIPAADVEEIVRCKDCKYAYINFFTDMNGTALCRYWTKHAEGIQAIMSQDEFCSRGERKENNE